MDIEGKTVYFDGPEIKSENSHWVLTKEYTVRIGTTDKLVCPEGMWTDGASIPRFFWRLIGPPLEAPNHKAAIAHDGGYMGELVWYRKIKAEWVAEEYTRKEVDELFRELLKALKVSKWRRTMMYLAVRWFGGKHWTAR